MTKQLPTAPAGTSGLAIAPWSRDEWYAVAANWAEASAPVWTLGSDGWTASGQQVADYRHNPHDALREQLAEALAAGGDDPDGADALIDDAEVI